MEKKKSGLSEILDKETETIIIGTFPSEISREQKEYYANEEKNDFWKILRQKYNVSLNNYEDKLNLLKQHKIGLWDIFTSCFIEDSKNKTIKYDNNDFNKIVEKLSESNIKKIIINGKSKSKGTIYFFNRYKKYIKERGLNIPNNIEIKVLYMPTGQYYKARKEQIIKEWLQELPD